MLFIGGLYGCSGGSVESSSIDNETLPDNSSPESIIATGTGTGTGTGTDSDIDPNTDTPQPAPPTDSLTNQVVLTAADQIEALSTHNNFITPAPSSDLDAAANSLSHIPEYSYPGDFPVSQNLALLHAGLRVTDLKPLTAYRFSVTGTAQQALFVFNLSDGNQVAGPVCIDNLSCTGTVTNGTALIIIVAENSATNERRFTIEESSLRAVYNEGSATMPVELIGSLPLTHSGAVGPITTLNQTLVAGQSYYRLTRLNIGDRYRLSITNLQSGDARADFTQLPPLYCDPNFSSTNSCQFVAAQEQVEFTVKGDNAIFGDAFDLTFEQLAPHHLFDGSWHSPFTISTSDEHTVRHLAISDHDASSYYQLRNLNPTIDYHVFATGKTNGLSLSVFDVNTGNAIYSPNCDALGNHNNQLSGDEICTITASTVAYLRAEATSLNVPTSLHGTASSSEGLLSIVPGVSNQGSVTDPIILTITDSAATHFDVSVKNHSVYEVRNLPTNRAMLFSIAGATSVTSVTPMDNNGNQVPCESSGHIFCVVTPRQSTQLLRISADDVRGGQRLKLTVAPSPDNQSISLPSDQLPYQGSVGDWYSNYTINGLTPNTLYLVEAANASASLEIAAWPGNANVIDCINRTRNSFTAGCGIKADNTGSINFRASTTDSQPGAFFTVDAIPALPLSSEFTSADTPLRVPDNDAAGVTSFINVQNVSVITDISVSLLLEHGYSQDIKVTLISPEGQRVILAEHVSQSRYTHTVFTDLAARDSTSAEASRYRRSFRPAEPLHPLRDINANGQWQLHIADDRDSNISTASGGTLISWGISFSIVDETGYPEPQP